jgi:hypothetical protein
MALKRAPPGGRLLTALRYTERRAECHAARSGWGIKRGSVENSSGQASICEPSFPGRPEIDLEPEVEAWLLDLPYSHYQRVMRNVDDFLVTGGVPDGDHVKKLQDADDIYELRVALDRTTRRISFWKPGARVIILLTVFRKTCEGVQRADVDGAIRAKKTCQADHDMTITHHFERSA